MLTKEEANAIKLAISIVDHVAFDCKKRFGMTETDLIQAVKRVTYAPGQGTDVIADGPKISTRQMLDEAARLLGWRTDFACGDSPITWELVLEEIRKLKNRRVAEVVTCVACNGRLVIKKREGNRYEGVCLDGGCGVTWTQETKGG